MENEFIQKNGKLAAISAASLLLAGYLYKYFQ
jgi:hypothetical protein